MPRVIQFLGYDPLPVPKSLAEKLLAHRKTLGLSQSAMARRVGIDPTTLSRLERRKSRKPLAKTLRKICSVVKNQPDS